MPAHRALGKDERLMACAIQGTGNDLFRMSKTIDGRGVDPVDTEIERAVNRMDGFGVVLRPPAKFPVAATDGPRAKANWSKTKIRISKSAKCLRCRSCSCHHTKLDETD